MDLRKGVAKVVSITCSERRRRIEEGEGKKKKKKMRKVLAVWKREGRRERNISPRCYEEGEGNTRGINLGQVLG